MKKNIFIVFLVLVNLSLAELIVRYTITKPVAECFDPAFGFLERPFATVLNTREGYASFQLDGLGFNNNPLPNPLPKNRYLLIGDSFLQAYQVEREFNFASLLGQSLGNDYLIYNAGVSGLDPTRADLLVNKLAPKLQPTRLVLVVTSSDLFDMMKWDVVEDEKGSIVAFNWDIIEMTPFRQWKMDLYGFSALISHLKRKYQSVIENWWKVHFSSKENKVEEPWQISESLKRFHFAMELLAKREIPVTILFLPMFSYNDKGVVIQANQSLEKLEMLSKDMGFGTVNVEQAFKKDFNQTHQPAVGFYNSKIGYGHLNKRGHKLVANEMLKYFQKSNMSIKFK